MIFGNQSPASASDAYLGHDGPVNEPAPHGEPRFGVKAFGRFAVLILLSMAFLALAVANWLVDRAWIVIVAYVICAGVLLLVARNVFPRRVPRQVTPPPKGSSKRSGNPAVRASGSAPDRRDDSQPR
jgi:hypothetical protein